MVGESLDALLAAQEDFSTYELADNQMHREVMSVLVLAIKAILSRDNQSGLAELQRMPDEILLNESMLWVASFWRALAHRNAGDTNSARMAMKEALSLAKSLGPRDHSTSLSTLAEIEYQSDNFDEAHGYLEEAMLLSANISDRRGQATARLAQARIQAAAGRPDEASFTAHNALVLDPSWPAPVVFLARQAMLDGKLKKAEQILSFLMRLDPQPPEAGAELGLLQVISSKHIPLRVLREYLRLEEALPSDEVVKKFKELVQISPEFLHMREKLAWKLLHLGRKKEAEEHFKILAEQELDMDMRSSVRLGLGTAATLTEQPQQPGKRLAAAVSSVPESLKGTTDRYSRPTSVQPAVNMPPPPPAEAFEVSVQGRSPTSEVEVTHTDDAEIIIEAEPGPPDVRDQSKTMPFATEEQQRVIFDAAPPPSEAEVEQQRSAGEQSTMDKLDGRKAVFKGGLQHLGVPELLQFFHSSRMTGTLLISAEQGLGAVHFNGGMIAGAASPSCSNLGVLLISEGIVTKDQIEKATTTQADGDDDRLLGSIVVEQGLASKEAMSTVLENQVFLAIGEMMDWREGQFAFSPDSDKEPRLAEVEINLDPQMVLLDVLGGD